MNKNAEKILDMLGVEPCEKFKIKINDFIDKDLTYFFTYDLCLIEKINNTGAFRTANELLNGVLTGRYEIIKISKKKSKKIKDLSIDEIEHICCKSRCGVCPLRFEACTRMFLRLNPDALSSKVLEAVVEVPDDEE